MLSAIREKTQGIIATFILLLVVIPFALWGVNSYFETGGNLKVAKVDGVDITQAEYRRTLDQLRGRLDPKALDNPQIKRTILDNLIDQTLLLRDAEHQGFRIGSAQLAEMIRQLPAFQRNGQFDPALYEARLRQEGMSPAGFERRMREEILINSVQIGLRETRIVTPSEVATLNRLAGQEREVAYAEIGAEAYLAGAEIKPADIERYYTEHPQMYRFPEQVRIEYIELSASALDRDIRPTEEDLKRAYTEEAARFTTPERRRASHILINLPATASEAEAKQALERIQALAQRARAGGSFAELAKQNSEDRATASQGGDLGEIRRGILPKELEDVVYSLKPGEISQPVRSTYGYHIIKLTEYTPAKRRSFESVRNELMAFVKRRKAEDRFIDAAEKFRNLVYEQPDSLAPAAKALGLEVKKSDWFTSSGGAGIASNPKVVRAAFEPDVLNQVRNSDAIEIDNDTIAAVRVAERRPAGRKTLAEVRPQIERLLQQEAALKNAQRAGEAMLNELRAGTSLEAAAKKHRARYHPGKTITRLQAQGMDGRIVAAAFRAARPAEGKPVYDLVPLGERGYAVMALTRVREGNAKADNKPLHELLMQQRSDGYYQDYRDGLRKQADIKIYPDQL